MSLINQMLQDLDARRAAHGAGVGLPNDVRPLPQAPSSRWPAVLTVGALALIAAIGYFWYAHGMAQPPAPATQPVVGAEAVIEPVAPAPTRVALDDIDVSLRLADLDAPRAAPAAVDKSATAAEAPDQSPAIAPIKPSAKEATRKPVEKTPVDEPVRNPAARASIAKANEKQPAVGERQQVSRQKEKAPVATPQVPKAAAAVTPAAEKSARPPVIERTTATALPRERAENEYRKAINAVNQGNAGEAQERLHEALRQDGLHVAARQLLVKLLLESKQGEGAMRVLREGLAGQPAQIGWAMSLARLQVDQGDLAGAWKTLDFSRPVAAKNADYLGFCAHLLQRLGRNQEAAEQYLQATRLAPADGRWWLGLGLTLESLGRTGEARDAFQRARQSGNLGPELMALIEQKLR